MWDAWISSHCHSHPAAKLKESLIRHKKKEKPSSFSTPKNSKALEDHNDWIVYGGNREDTGRGRGGLGLLGCKVYMEGGAVMLSRSLTSCLIKPLTNDFVLVINGICSLKRSVHIEWNPLLGAVQGLSRYMIIEVRGVFTRRRTDMCELQANGWREGRWAASLYSKSWGVLAFIDHKKREESRGSCVYKPAIMAENWQLNTVMGKYCNCKAA